MVNRVSAMLFVYCAFSLLTASLPQAALAEPVDAACSRMPPHTVVSLTDDEILRELNDDSDKTSAVKEFNREWVRTLTDRGEPISYTRENSADFEYIGMPIGGICTGQLYFGGDGKLWYWDIFNTKAKSDTHGIESHRDPYRRSETNCPAQHYPEQGFAVRVRSKNQTVTKKLDRDGFKDITFKGQYPIAEVTYSDDTMPVDVELQAFSPFVPLDLESSNYPATVLIYRITNTSAESVVGELFGWLENAVCIASRQSRRIALRNQVKRTPALTTVQLDAVESQPAASSANPREPIVFEDFEGDLDKWTATGDAFSQAPAPNFHRKKMSGYKGQGLADSFLNGGDRSITSPQSDQAVGTLVSEPFVINRKTICFLIGGGNHNGETCVNLVVDGKVVRSATAYDSETLSPREFNVAGLEGKTAHLEIVDNSRGSWGHVMVDHIEFADEVSDDATPLPELPDYGSMALAVIGAEADCVATTRYQLPQGEFSDEAPATLEPEEGVSAIGAAGERFSLKPGESTEVRFVLAWYFPNSHGFPIVTPQTRYYGARFDSATEVADEVAGRIDELTQQTRLWRDTWYDSTLPYWFLDRTFLNTSCLATNTSYLFADGRFYGYEGVYHGHGTCNHVWGYVQAPGRLFPVLEQRLREMVDYKPGVGFKPDTGFILHRAEARSGDAVDGQAGTLLRTYLVHQMQPNNDFLSRVYPSAKKAMNYMTEQYDADRDGILTGSQFNTLDAAWYGKITWLSLHYTAALHAMAAMADEMGDSQYAEECRELAARGRDYIESDLFNGEYFFHQADPEHPESPGIYNGLEYSQLLGQSWAYQVGLGLILDPAKTTTHLRSLWKYNFTTDVGPFREEFTNGRWYAMPGEGGIIACTWPHGGENALKLGNQHYAGYLNECQPGYEWAVTSLLMWHDMPYHALAHTRTMHERYHGSKRNPWNEVEWGDHYSRSMASYGVFTGVCGFEYHGPSGYLAFSPRITPERFKAAFTTAEGWGTFEQHRSENEQTETVDVRWGKLAVEKLAFDLPGAATAKEVIVTAAGKEVPSQWSTCKNRISIDLPEAITIDSGERLTVVARYE